MNPNKTKTTRGRQKIEIKKIENINHRQVTFTKRRGGLFKKASELCILTGADMTIIVKSPGGRTFAFGHPSVEAVVERYLGGGGEANEVAAVTAEMARGFRERYDDVAEELLAEKRRREVIMGSGGGSDGGFWWEEPIDELGVDELESYVAALEELRKKVGMRADEMQMLTRLSNNPMLCSNSSDPMLAMNQINCEISSNELAFNHFINQTHDDSVSMNSLVPLGCNFGHGHVA